MLPLFLKNCCFILLLFCFSNVFAQQPVKKIFNRSSGLPSNFVYSVVQDSKGFIWFGTDKGVARYDGFEMDVFDSNPLMSSLDVWYFYEDTKGRIWFFTNSGNFYFYSYEDEKLHTIQNPFDKGVSLPIISFLENIDGSISTNWVSVITECGSEKVYYTIHKDLSISRHIVNNVSDKSHRVKTNLSQPTTSIPCFLEADYDLLNGIIPVCSKENAVTDGKTFCFYENTENLIVVETQNKVTEKKYKDLGIRDQKILWVYFMNDSILSLKFEKEIILTDLNLKRIHTYDNIYKEKLRHIILDKSGNLMAVTNFEGVFQYSFRDFHFGWFGSKYFDGNDEIRHILKVKENEFYISASDGSVYCVRFSDYKIKSIRKKVHFNGYVRQMVLTQDKQTILLLIDNDYYHFAMIHLGSQHKSFPFLSNYTPFKYSKDVELYRIQHFKSIQQAAGDIILSSSHEFIHLSSDNNYTNSWVDSRNRIMDAVYQKNNNTIWTCGPGGIISYDTQSKKFNEQKIYNSTDHLFLIDSTYVFASSGNEGLFNITYGVRKHILGTDGLIVYDVKKMINNQIFIAGSKGLYDLSPNFSQAIKVKAIQDKDIFCMEKYSKDVYLLGTNRGLLMFDFNERPPIQRCPPSLKNFKIGSYLFTNSPVNIELAFGNNNLSAGIAVPCIHDENIKVKYKLKGYDEDYILSSDRKINYKRLPSGDFILSIIVMDEEGIIGEKNINIKILKHWSVTLWFRIALSLCIISIIILIINYFSKRRILENEKKLDMERVMINQKLAALQHQLNPHFVFNVLHSIQAFIAKKDTISSNYYIVRFSRLMRNVLESSREQYIPVRLEIDILKTYLELEKMRFGDKFSFYIECKSVDDEFLIPTMIVQPFVENALKHGIKKVDYHGEIEILFELIESILHVVISDNGPGIVDEMLSNESISSNYKSRGLEITRERLEAYSAQGKYAISFNIRNNTVTDKYPSGTRVDIYFKMLS